MTDESKKKAEDEIEETIPVFTFALCLFAFNIFFFTVNKWEDAPYGAMLVWLEFVIFTMWCIVILYKRKTKLVYQGSV